MFLTIRENKAAIVLVDFTRVNCKKALDRFSDMLKEYLILKETFSYHYFAFSFFVIEYTCKSFFKDEIELDKFIKKYYEFFFESLIDNEIYKSLINEVSLYSDKTRFETNIQEILEHTVIIFLNQLFYKVDYRLAERVNAEFTEIEKTTKQILMEFRLLEK